MKKALLTGCSCVARKRLSPVTKIIPTEADRVPTMSAVSGGGPARADDFAAGP